MNFSSYFVLSTLVVTGIVAHAYVAHEQFYPAVVYLSTDKMCLAVMYNFAFALFLLFGKAVLRLFIGTLRDLEVEQLVDSGRGFVADTILFLVFYAPTIDNQEVGTVYMIQYICCVIFMKGFHLATQIRVSHMFEVGVPRLIVNIKLVALMCLLLSFDIVACQYFYGVASRSSTFFTWILFEALTMSTVVVVSICKYSVHMVDLRLDNGWPGKSVCLFYIDLIHDVVSMTLFLVFMMTFFVQNPSRLPIYMMADVIQVARKLAQRLHSFRRYRRISLNMEMRFPDATDEEIEQNEHCVICRESLFEGSKPKKLSCTHIFHIDCLRSWLVMQQVCPTCRAEIPADGPAYAAAEGPAADAGGPAAERDVAQIPIVPGFGETPPAVAAEPATTATASSVADLQVPTTAASAATLPAVTPGVSLAPMDPAVSGANAEFPPVAVSHDAVRPSEPTPGGGTQKPTMAGTPSLAGGSTTVASVAATRVSPLAGSTASPSTVAPAAPESSAVGVPKSLAPGPAPLAKGPSFSATVAALASVTRPGAPASASSSAGHVAAAELGDLQLLLGSPFSALGSAPAPPLQDIMEGLKRAEDVAKFLREQTAFWMEQVRQIQQTHCSGGDPAGLLAGGSSPSAVQTPLLPPGTGHTAATAGSAANEEASEATARRVESSPLGSGSPAGGGLADIRRLQQEQWERKRSSGSLASPGT
eukprot:TRINITY_DN24070_c0_g3_i2.p1 TRINITY_DN24070_c0_g3~~TRINITY_DN24070_c0_g3_i2.p1  ORF type:complete len:702 (+),score=113.45 TRINITY_DN24070_c0_g3_i2:101-2206(+)